MTAQAEDLISYNNVNYCIVNRDSCFSFSPGDYGIMPFGVCTACWGGYRCSYKITDFGIFLENLYINSFSGEYPEINGVLPEDDELDGMGHHIYRNVNIPINYTGKLLLGKGFIWSYYIHGGYQRPWSYSILTELVFENGSLINVIDQSKVAQDIREKAKESFGDMFFQLGEMTEDFVEKTYIANSRDLPWWLK